MSVFEKEEVVHISLSQPYSDDTTVAAKGSEVDAAERRFLLEHILDIQPRKMGVTRLTLKGDQNTLVWKGEEILGELLDQIGGGEPADRDWLVQNWETLQTLILDPMEIEKHFVGNVLKALLRDHGMDISEPLKPIRHDRWIFEVRDGMGAVIASWQLSDTDDFPDMSSSRRGKGCRVVVLDGEGEACVSFPIEEYLFLRDFAACVAREDDPTEWNIVNDLIRSGATSALVLTHYPEYLAFLRAKGWEEMDRPEGFRKAVVALWQDESLVGGVVDGIRNPLHTLDKVIGFVKGL